MPSYWMDFLHRLADFSDEISRHYFQKSFMEIKVKSDNSPVCEADIEIEKQIRKMASQTHPELEILGEEFSGANQDPSQKRLIIDPIDGTANFIRGIPVFATLLAIEEDNKIIAGLVSAGMTKERWWASIGNGSFYNKMPIKTSGIKELSEAQVFHGSLYGYEAEKAPQGYFELLKRTQRQRGFGDYYAHMLVAMGCGECAVDFGIKPWDVAPIKIIVEEAGGKCTDIQGKSNIYSSTILSTNKYLHKRAQHILTSK